MKDSSRVLAARGEERCFAGEREVHRGQNQTGNGEVSRLPASGGVPPVLTPVEGIEDNHWETFSCR